jgi:hypothetical protein
MHIKLYPLRIPSGWAVTYNAYFADTAMEVENNRILNSEYFKEDLLMIQQLKLDQGTWVVDDSGWLIDVGWYPDSDPTGAYRLTLVRGGWDEIIFQVVRKKGSDIQQLIDEMLDDLARKGSVQSIAQRMDRFSAEQ